MATRPTTSQNLHDRVIDRIAGRLDKEKYKVHVNKGPSKEWSVKGWFPDIIVTLKDSNSVQFIIEVETADSVTPEEARDQWKAYAELPGTFFIITPKDSLRLAKTITAGQGIKARFGYFTVDAMGAIDITYERNSK